MTLREAINAVPDPIAIAVLVRAAQRQEHAMALRLRDMTATQIASLTQAAVSEMLRRKRESQDSTQIDHGDDS